MGRVKPIRWSPHALRSLTDREIDRAEADKTLTDPELVVPGQSRRQVLIRRYADTQLRQEMLLCVVVEETASDLVVVTAYRASKINKYLKEVGQ